MNARRLRHASNPCQSLLAVTGSRTALLERLTNVFTFCGVSYAGFFAVIAPSRPACWTLIVATFAAMQAPLVAKKAGSLRVATHYLTFVIFAALMGVTAVTGGLPSPSMLWLVTVPMVATILDGPRTAATWLFVVVLSIALMGLLELSGYAFAQTLTPHGMLMLRIAGIAGLSCSVFACVALQYVHVWKANRLLHEQATRDALTGLYNYRAMVHAMSDLIPAPRPQAPSFALVLVDVDHFKQINDRYGHATGDAVLEEVARRIRRCVRVADHVGRFGGEEFLCILPDCDEADAKKIAEDVREVIAASDVAVDWERIETTVSIGVACYRLECDDDAFAVLRRADEALYQSKRSGRNRVCTSGSSLPDRKAAVAV